MANHALLRANVTSGNAHIQYHGFCVGERSHSQATLRKAARSQKRRTIGKLVRQTNPKATRSRMVLVINRVAKERRA